MTDDSFDARFRDLAATEPPPALVERTLNAYRSARQRDAWRVRGFAAAGMMAMAALSLVVVSGPPHVGDPTKMVERGSGELARSLDVRVAVRRIGGSVERFATNQRYAAGDTLMFRVSVDQPCTVTLRREGVVLWTGPVSGEMDLPVGYTLEAGEPAARFGLDAGGEPTTVYLPAVAP